MSSQSPRNLLCQALVDPVGPADAYYMNYMYYIIILYIIHVCIKTSGLGKTETTRGIELKKREQTLIKHLLRERLCRIEFWGEEKLKSRHIWMNKSLLGKASMEKKKTFSFGHCPNYLIPPPMTPIRATWSSFFGSRNSRFESQFRTKNTICTI